MPSSVRQLFFKGCRILIVSFGSSENQIALPLSGGRLLNKRWDIYEKKLAFIFFIIVGGLFVFF